MMNKLTNTSRHVAVKRASKAVFGGNKVANSGRQRFHLNRTKKKVIDVETRTAWASSVCTQDIRGCEIVTKKAGSHYLNEEDGLKSTKPMSLTSKHIQRETCV